MAYRSETEETAMLQEKALSIRDYMQSETTLKELNAALPKWLDPDNFIRLFYTAMMKTPKLLLCSKQSLLSAMVEAAQIGLSPVLGKAALIPYKNEVQFQPMYKGLIEVARRFASITITAHVVYEADEFDMTWGDDEKIIHIPDFKNPDREKSRKIGAYDVWKGGDREIISRRFMTTGQIIHVRDTYSKAWESKGKKSVWGLHEDEMFIKTVIKNHTKLEPQCLEMERAVKLDDHVELGKTQLGMGDIHGLPMPTAFDFEVEAEEEESPQDQGKKPETQTRKAPGDVAKAMAASSGIPIKDIKEYIQYLAKKQEIKVEVIEANILATPDSFIDSLKRRLAHLKGGKSKQMGSVDAAHMQEFWNMRKGTEGKSGLKFWIEENFERIKSDFSDLVKKKLAEKFKVLYPGEAIPSPKKKEEVPEDDQSAQGGPGEETGEGETQATSDLGATKKPPFENPLTKGPQEEQGEGIGQSAASEVGKSIREGKELETQMLARYENSLESIMKFPKGKVTYTIEDFENYMKEMAQMEGLSYITFKVDTMKDFSFPEYYDKFLQSIAKG
ncbi:MAG TPA: hypothetical protein DDW42_01645 [Desulfobacteraceae bacterium]|nr:hypothetical protein [Desulfobacteraceae bacterium]